MRKTAVATVTSYDLKKPDMEVRAELALRTIEDAVHKNCAVVVVDDGSTDSFIERAKGLSAVVRSQEGRGISRGQQQAIKLAHSLFNTDNYILIEPEKAGLLRDYFEQITAPVRDDVADIVLVGRTEGSMRTMTRIQRLIDSKKSEVISRILGFNADFVIYPL